ncbi:MAG: hypothetical protein LBG06_00260, partial [Deltaproteobacteria bacterium]|nr:hypothetical protein [Deltaproteobacteria bacterium]
MPEKPPGGFRGGLPSAVLAAWPGISDVTRNQTQGHPAGLPGPAGGTDLRFRGRRLCAWIIGTAGTRAWIIGTAGTRAWIIGTAGTRAWIIGTAGT